MSISRPPEAAHGPHVKTGHWETIEGTRLRLHPARAPQPMPSPPAHSWERIDGSPWMERHDLADASLLRLTGLADFAQKRPSELSGGMQQRASICRALIHKPRLLMLDEPFGALDAFTREQMQTLLLRLWHETNKQVLLITHDIEEAVFMATELVLLSPGPGRVVERLPLEFARRYVAGEPVRSIKSDPQFIDQREYVLSRVFEQREAFS